MDEEKIDISKYFTIKPETAFNNPVYIHSHTNSLQRAVNKMTELSDLNKMLEDIRKERNRIENLVYRTWEKLDQKKQELIQAGFPQVNGNPISLDQSESFKEFAKSVDYAKKQFDKWQKGEIKKRFDKNRSLKVIGGQVRFLGWDNIMDEFCKNLSKKLSMGKDVKVVIKREDIEGKNLKQIEKDFLRDYGTEISADSMASSLLKLGTFYNIVEQLTLTFPELSNIYKYDVDTLNYSSSVKKCLKTIKSGSSYFVKLGAIFELMHEKELTFTKYNNPAMASSFKKASLNVVSENLKENNELTTDVKVLLDAVNKQVSYGMTLKSNSNSFIKTKEVLTQNDMVWDASKEDRSIYRIVRELENIHNDPKYRYYVLNVQALSLVRFRQGYSHYIKVKKGGKPELDTPPSVSATQKLTHITEEIEIMLSKIIFVKSVVGSLYNNSVSMQKVETLKGLPVILSTPKKDYWTADILKYLMDLSQKSEYDTSILKKYVENYTPYNPYRNAEKKTALKNTLIKLYMAKARNAAQYYGKKNSMTFETIREVLMKKGDNRYEALKSDKIILALLKEAAKHNLMINEKRMKTLATKKWNIRFDYRDIKK